MKIIWSGFGPTYIYIYKIQLTQELNITDHGQRGTYADWVYEHQEVMQIFR